MMKSIFRLFKILYSGMFLGTILTGSVFSAVTAWRSLQSDAKGESFARSISKSLVDGFPGHDLFIDLYGGLMRILGRRTCNGTVRTTIGRLMRETGRCDVRPFADALKPEVERLSGTPFLFVAAPDCVDRNRRCLPRGLHAEANRCAWDLMAALKDMGIESLNLENCLADTPESVLRHFYKTDHHWNCLASRKAAALVTERVCRRLRVDVPDVRDLFLDDRNWVSHTVKNAWLGRLGARAGRYFCGLDDFTWYTTRRKARMSSYAGSKLLKRGTFNSVVVSKKHLKSLGRYHEATGTFGGTPEMVYGGRTRGELRFVNEDAPINRRIAVVKDSFGKSVAACLTLAFREVILLDPRHLPKDVSLRDAVARAHPDMVVEIISACWVSEKICIGAGAYRSCDFDFFDWQKK